MTFLNILDNIYKACLKVTKQDDWRSSNRSHDRIGDLGTKIGDIDTRIGDTAAGAPPQQLGGGNFGGFFERISVSDPGGGNNNVQIPAIGIGHHPPVSGLPPPVPARPLHIQQSHQFWSFGHFSDGVGGHTQSGQLFNTP